MREEIRFIAEDGQEFKTKEECLYHEKMRRFLAWYADNSLYSEGSYVNPEALIQWANYHSDKVTLVFKGDE